MSLTPQPLLLIIQLQGGGIRVRHGVHWMRNLSVADNAAVNAGAGLNLETDEEMDVSAEHLRITGNALPGRGGGLRAEATGDGGQLVLTLSDSIVENNTVRVPVCVCVSVCVQAQRIRSLAALMHKLR